MPTSTRRPFAAIALRALLATVLSFALPVVASEPAELLSLSSGMMVGTGPTEAPLMEDLAFADDVWQTPMVPFAPALPADSQAYDWYFLPEGLLYRSYLAGPHEPRISTMMFGDGDGGFCSRNRTSIV